MKQKTQAHLIAKKVCEQFIETPSLTLAKKLFKEHPEVYTDVEHARQHIRRIRGKSGIANRKKASDKTLHDDKPRTLNPFKLPKSYAKKRQHIDVKGSKILVLSDVHIPYHDVEALTLAIDTGIQEQCDTIILNGDALDCHMISEFCQRSKEAKIQRRTLCDAHVLIRVTSSISEREYLLQRRKSRRKILALYAC